MSSNSFWLFQSSLVCSITGTFMAWADSGSHICWAFYAVALVLLGFALFVSGKELAKLKEDDERL